MPITRDKTLDLNNISPGARNARLGTLLVAMQQDIAALAASERLLANAGLVIKAGGSPTVKAANAFSVIAAGVVQTKTAATDMAALVGTLATAKAALWAFYIDSAGTLTSSTKTADAANANAALALKPAVPSGKVEIGYIIVANATGSNFVGGTTALDAANVTTTYVSNAPLTPASAATALALS